MLESWVTLPETNIAGWKIHHEWRCISYQKWWFFIVRLVTNQRETIPNKDVKGYGFYKLILVIPARGPAKFFQQLDFPIQKSMFPQRMRSEEHVPNSLNILIPWYVTCLYTLYIQIYTSYFGRIHDPAIFSFQGKIYIFNMCVYINVAAQTSTFF